MTITQFETVAKNQLSACETFLTTKGKEYALQPDIDRLDHFKVAAAITGGSPHAALWGMLAKHLVSLADMCKSEELFTLERWNEKITDSINYLVLLKAIAMEDYESRVTTVSLADITVPSKIELYKLQNLEVPSEEH